MPEQVMQAKKSLMMAVLYAVPSALIDVEWLLRQPSLLDGFHEALKALPDSPEKLSGLALSARLCVTEDPGDPLSCLAPSGMA